MFVSVRYLRLPFRVQLFDGLQRPAFCLPIK
jgi:hypothetical protein